MDKAVLVVDDCPIIRSYVIDALNDAGYRTLEAVDGRDALLKLDGRTLDLIISDLDMPNMGGLEFIEAARGLEDYRTVPVIIHSASGSEMQNSHGDRINAQLWLNKPVLPDDLLKQVSRLIGNSRGLANQAFPQST